MRQLLSESLEMSYYKLQGSMKPLIIGYFSFYFIDKYLKKQKKYKKK